MIAVLIWYSVKRCRSEICVPECSFLLFAVYVQLVVEPCILFVVINQYTQFVVESVVQGLNENRGSTVDLLTRLLLLLDPSELTGSNKP